MPDPLVYETHMHTPLCRHAVGNPEDYAAQAARRGMRGIIVTCHCPLPDGISASVRMAPEEWHDYLDLVRTARSSTDEVDIRLGLESDFLPGLEPYLEELHNRTPLDYVLGSVHPHIEEYKQRYLRWDWPAFHRQYFSSLVEAASTGLFDCLSHPDLVKNLGSESWDLNALMPHILKCLDDIAATGIAMELNTSGIYKTIPEMNPSAPILAAMRERGIPVVVGADAHLPDRVGDLYELAYDLLESAGYDQVRHFLNRQPIDTPIRMARASLRREE